MERRKGNRKRAALLAMPLAAACMMAWSFPAMADGGIELSTEYPGMSAKPGDSLNITIDMDNTSGSDMDVSMQIAEMPEGWDGYLKGGSYEVSRVHVKSGEDSDVTLHVDVPDEMTEGTYQVVVMGTGENGGADRLNLSFDVTEENAGRGSFSSE